MAAPPYPPPSNIVVDEPPADSSVPAPAMPAPAVPGPLYRWPPPRPSNESLAAKPAPPPCPSVPAAAAPATVPAAPAPAGAVHAPLTDSSGPEMPRSDRTARQKTSALAGRHCGSLLVAAPTSWSTAGMTPPTTEPTAGTSELTCA